MSDYIYTIEYGEGLKHWGVKGQRWGIRRYQNKDGSLTPAGKKRVQKLDNERRALTGRKTPFAKNPSLLDNPSKTKKMDDMSNDELKRAIARKKSEVEYSRTLKEYESLNPKPISAGQKFAKMLQDNVMPTLLRRGTDAAMDYVQNAIKKHFGDDAADSLATMKEKLNIEKLKADIDATKAKTELTRSTIKKSDEPKVDKTADAKAEQDAYLRGMEDEAARNAAQYRYNRPANGKDTVRPNSKLSGLLSAPSTSDGQSYSNGSDIRSTALSGLTSGKNQQTLSSGKAYILDSFGNQTDIQVDYIERD